MLYKDIPGTFAAEATYDTRRYPYGPPLDAGLKGWRYRLWKDAFIARLGTYEFKDSNQASTLQDTCTGHDDGGDQTPPGQPGPLPLAGGAPAANRRAKRLKMLYSIIHTNGRKRKPKCM